MPATDETTAQLVTELVVPHLEEALRFLTGLGFQVVRTDATFVVLRWAEAFLFVAENPAATCGARWCNVRVIVPDANALYEKAKRLGPVTPIGDRSYGLRDFIVRGPAGIEIRFAQLLPAR